MPANFIVTVLMNNVHRRICVVCAGTRKYKAARDVLRKLPPDSVEVVKRNWRMRVKDMHKRAYLSLISPSLPLSSLSLSHCLTISLSLFTGW